VLFWDGVDGYAGGVAIGWRQPVTHVQKPPSWAASRTTRKFRERLALSHLTPRATRILLSGDAARYLIAS
jgi:hypothetical protein